MTKRNVDETAEGDESRSSETTEREEATLRSLGLPFLSLVSVETASMGT